MSELKVHRFITTDELFPQANAGVLYYEKSEADKVIEELKAKLEDVQATAYAESVDAGMENRRLKRALWLARAKSAENAVTNWCPECMKKWNEVERKCRAKAEEYK